MSGRQQSASREVRGLTRRPVSVVPCFSGCLSLCLFKSAATWAKYWITFLVLSVLPAPLSPLLCRNDWLFPQLYIMYINANDIFPINWEPFFSLSACSSTLNVCSSPLSTCSHTPSTRSHALSTRSITPSTCIILSVPAVVHPLPAVILSVPAVVYPVPAVILPVPAVVHPLPQSSLSNRRSTFSTNIKYFLFLQSPSESHNLLCSNLFIRKAVFLLYSFPLKLLHALSVLFPMKVS